MELSPSFPRLFFLLLYWNCLLVHLLKRTKKNLIEHVNFDELTCIDIIFLNAHDFVTELKSKPKFSIHKFFFVCPEVLPIFTGFQNREFNLIHQNLPCKIL